MSQNRLVTLEGSGTPDILLNKGEAVLLDISQGARDLGLSGLIFRHKGRLIATNRRAIYFKKKTKDYELEQLNMGHSGYVKMGYTIGMVQFLTGLMTVISAIGLFSISIFLGLILLVVGLFALFTSRRKGLVLSGSGAKINFTTVSIPASELTKIVTIVAANS